MGATPQELKHEIDLTRADLAANVDALAEKVTPSPRARQVALLSSAAGLIGLLLLRRRRRRM